MWEDFNLRVKSCASYASAAREALWLFRQLKSEVLNDTWVWVGGPGGGGGGGGGGGARILDGV
jgi:hypothetical protein